MNRKALFLVIFSLIIVTASFLMISVWAYQEYFSKKQPGEKIALISNLPKNSNDLALSKSTTNLDKPTVITSGISELDTTLSLDEKQKEYDRLKNELVNSALARQTPSDSILQRIAFLENSILELNNRNEQVAEDNRKLGRLLKEMSNIRGEKNIKRQVSSSVDNVPVKEEEGSSVKVTNISLVAAISGGESSPTLPASKAEELQVFFNVKNSNQKTGVFSIVILLPDGRVLRQSGWETGVFNTSTGKKVYTAQVHLNEDSEAMQLTVKSPNLTDGIYTIQIYFEGNLVGQLRKRLG